jgi:UDP-N-acetyl-D-mannosaminuronic acid dehydrogenase
MSFNFDICVVGGCGHVGLPLALAFADRGSRVVAQDIDAETVALVSECKMPFREHGAQEVLARVLGKTFAVTTDQSVIKDSRYVVVTIGTPLDDHLNPIFTLMTRFFDGLKDQFLESQTIILRSTVCPGTTAKLKAYFERHGIRAKLAFCPERIAEGIAMTELFELPQIVSSFDKKVAEDIAELFRKLTPHIIFLEPLEAELAKLFTNSWRYVQFAVANQFFMLASNCGLDFYRIYAAMTERYPRTADFPKPGFTAGPCLLKDTMQLAAFSNNSFFLGHSAMLVNEGLPNHLVQRLKTRIQLHDKTVGILGMAFKADSDDIRESLSVKLKKILELEAKEVLCTDPFIKRPYYRPPDEVVHRSDVLILGAPHTEYKELNLANKEVVDIWNFFGTGGHI